MSDPVKAGLVPEAKRILDEYLRSISFRSEVYYRGQVCEDWYLDTSGSGHINVHVVCHGDCWFRLPGLNEPQQLFEGDVVVLPHDASHLLLSAPGLPAQYGQISKPHQIVHDRAHPGTALFCGYLIVDKSTYGSVFAMLPEFLIIRSHRDTDAQQFRALIDLLFAETQADHLGSPAILDRLTDAMMFYVIRHALAQDSPSTGLLAGLLDKQIRTALAAMCDEPAQAWTVDALAEKVFMSRSSFAERFNTLVGKSPIEFLTEWRMQRARHWLERDRLSVADVAARCGYQSENAFSKAFKRITGVGPGEFRRARSPK
jgi:AraC family transcriptional regulator, activator of mtrCDE